MPLNLLHAVPDVEVELPAPPGLRWRPVGQDRRAVALFDTWTSSLWSAGLVLLVRSTEATLHERRASGLSQPVATLKTRKLPRFGWELPPGEFADRLRPLLGLRALLPVVRLSLRSRRFEARNEDDKAVARAAVEAWSAGEQAAAGVSVSALRGYDAEAKAVGKALRAAGHPPVGSDPLAELLQSLGLEPRAWSAKPDFHLAPDDPAAPAVVGMVRQLLALARETEEGLVGDWDTEFLHHYRVLTRKARSVLALTRGALAASDTDELIERFKALAKRTNELRDRDVHLLARAAQEARVPADLRPGLAPLFAEVARRRAAAFRSVRRHLGSAAYAAEIEQLQQALAVPDPGPRGAEPLDSMSSRLLWKAWRRLARDGQELTADSPDEQVHELRLRAKKLRYLLEFFGPLFDRKAISALTKHLKQLQDVLGDFNDISVQQEELATWLAAVPREATTVAAVGALRGALHAEHQRLRAQVDGLVAAFVADEPAARALFTNPAAP